MQRVVDWSRFMKGNRINRISNSEGKVPKLPILQLIFFTCAVSVDLRTIYKIFIIRIFVAAVGKII